MKIKINDESIKRICDKKTVEYHAQKLIDYFAEQEITLLEVEQVLEVIKHEIKVSCYKKVIKKS